MTDINYSLALFMNMFSPNYLAIMLLNISHKRLWLSASFWPLISPILYVLFTQFHTFRLFFAKKI